MGLNSEGSSLKMKPRDLIDLLNLASAWSMNLMINEASFCQTDVSVHRVRPFTRVKEYAAHRHISRCSSDTQLSITYEAN